MSNSIKKLNDEISTKKFLLEEMLKMLNRIEYVYCHRNIELPVKIQKLFINRDVRNYNETAQMFHEISELKIKGE